LHNAHDKKWEKVPNSAVEILGEFMSNERNEPRIKISKF
jgi:hypothetical protein